MIFFSPDELHNNSTLFLDSTGKKFECPVIIQCGQNYLNSLPNHMDYQKLSTSKFTSKINRSSVKMNKTAVFHRFQTFQQVFLSERKHFAS